MEDIEDIEDVELKDKVESMINKVKKKRKTKRKGKGKKTTKRKPKKPKEEEEEATKQQILKSQELIRLSNRRIAGRPSTTSAIIQPTRSKIFSTPRRPELRPLEDSLFERQQQREFQQARNTTMARQKQRETKELNQRREQARQTQEDAREAERLASTERQKEEEKRIRKIVDNNYKFGIPDNFKEFFNDLLLENRQTLDDLNLDDMRDYMDVFKQYLLDIVGQEEANTIKFSMTERKIRRPQATPQATPQASASPQDAGQDAGQEQQPPQGQQDQQAPQGAGQDQQAPQGAGQEQQPPQGQQDQQQPPQGQQDQQQQQNDEADETLKRQLKNDADLKRKNEQEDANQPIPQDKPLNNGAPQAPPPQAPPPQQAEKPATTRIIPRPARAQEEVRPVDTMVQSQLFDFIKTFPKKDIKEQEILYFREKKNIDNVYTEKTNSTTILFKDASNFNKKFTNKDTTKFNLDKLRTIAQALDRKNRKK